MLEKEHKEIQRDLDPILIGVTAITWAILMLGVSIALSVVAVFFWVGDFTVFDFPFLVLAAPGFAAFLTACLLFFALWRRYRGIFIPILYSSVFLVCVLITPTFYKLYIYQPEKHYAEQPSAQLKRQAEAHSFRAHQLIEENFEHQRILDDISERLVNITARRLGIDTTAVKCDTFLRIDLRATAEQVSNIASDVKVEFKVELPKTKVKKAGANLRSWAWHIYSELYFERLARNAIEGRILYLLTRDVVLENIWFDKEKLRPDSNLVDDLGATELELVELNMSINEEFAVEIADSDMEEMKSVGDIWKYVQSDGLTICEGSRDRRHLLEVLYLVAQHLGVDPTEVDIRAGLTTHRGLSVKGLNSVVEELEELHDIKFIDSDKIKLQTVEDIAKLLRFRVNEKYAQEPEQQTE
jgi:acyl carrier protein